MGWVLREIIPRVNIPSDPSRCCKTSYENHTGALAHSSLGQKESQPEHTQEEWTTQGTSTRNCGLLKSSLENRYY